MKRILRAVALALSLAGAAAPLNAADRLNQAQLQETMARLELTEAQKQAVRPILEAGIRERVQILQAAGFEPGKKPSLRQLRQVRGPLGESRARTEAQLSGILSTAQMEELRSIAEERRQKMKQQFR